MPNSYPERFGMPFASLSGTNNSNNHNNMSSNNNMSDIDETSMDNIPTVQNSSTIGNSSPSETIQMAADKCVLAEAQDIIASLQYDGQDNNELINQDVKTMKQDQDDEAIGDDFDDFEDELAALIDGPFMTEQEIAFNLQAPNIVPHYLSLHYICESGSRILFLSIFWIKKFRCFRLLRYEYTLVHIKRKHKYIFFIMLQPRLSNNIAAQLLGRTICFGIVTIVALDFCIDHYVIVNQFHIQCYCSGETAST